jgi:hypothetical protein
MEQTMTTPTTLTTATEPYKESEGSGTISNNNIYNKLFSWFRNLFKRGSGGGGERKKKRQSSQPSQPQQQQQGQQVVVVPSEEDVLLATTSSDTSMDYEQEEDKVYDDDDDDDGNTTSPVTTFQPFVVMTLTVVGSLDEISYFPLLILGKVFTPIDIIISTFLASICMVCIVTTVPAVFGILRFDTVVCHCCVLCVGINHRMVSGIKV